MLDIPKLRVGDVIEVQGMRFKLVAFSNPKMRPPRVLFQPVHLPPERHRLPPGQTTTPVDVFKRGTRR